MTKGHAGEPLLDTYNEERLANAKRPLVPPEAGAREIFGKENDFVVFLRPDNHIAFISSELSIDETRSYLNEIAERSKL